MISRRRFICGSALVLTGGVVAGARRGFGGPVTIDEIGDHVQTLPKEELPDFAGPGTPNIRATYRYAVARGDELRYIPCFCGCARFGHTSNRDCYVKSANKDGTITFTSHAAT